MRLFGPLEGNKNELRQVAFQTLAGAPADPIVGQVYRSQADGLVYVWGGGAWVYIGALIDASVTLAKLAANSVDASKIVDGTITNAEIAAGAAIALSKLATDPLARAGHTGTQVAATISDFVTAARAAMDKATIDALNVDADTIDGFDSAALEKVANKNQANGYAGLGADGKIPDGLLPALAISDTFVVASEAAQLALAAQPGDIAVRTDTNETYILRVAPANVLANWEELRFPGGGGGTVTSVTGAAPITSTGGANPEIGLAANGVQQGHIADNAVGTGELIDGSVTDAKIVSVAVAKVVGAVQKRVATIGDGVASVFVINHALNTLDVGQPSVKDLANGEFVFPNVSVQDANNVVVDFGTFVPAANAFRVVVLG